MAILLTKDINRETLAVKNTKGEKQIVVLKAGDMLEFRSKGKRFRYEVPLQSCYHMALIYTAHLWYKEKLAKYIKAKKEGRRAKRPRKLAPIFNAKYYEALKIK